MLPLLVGAAVSLGQAAMSKGGNQAPSGPTYLEGNKGPLANKAEADFSGWTVATGGSRADGARINKTSSDALGVPAGTPGSVGATLASIPPVLYVAGALVLVVMAWPRRSKK